MMNYVSQGAHTPRKPTQAELLQQAMLQQAMMRPRTPPWLLPAGIGLGVLMLIMTMDKGKG